MPTCKDLANLLSPIYTDGGNWVTNYKGTGINGFLVKGKADTDYESNEVFFPAAGWKNTYSQIKEAGSKCSYWSSTPYNVDYSYFLHFSSTEKKVTRTYQNQGRSVRAVLAE